MSQTPSWKTWKWERGCVPWALQEAACCHTGWPSPQLPPQLRLALEHCHCIHVSSFVSRKRLVVQCTSMFVPDTVYLKNKIRSWIKRIRLFHPNIILYFQSHGNNDVMALVVLTWHFSRDDLVWPLKSAPLASYSHRLLLMEMRVPFHSIPHWQGHRHRQ